MKLRHINRLSRLNQSSEHAERVQQFVSALQKRDLDQVRLLLSTHNINRALSKVDSDTSVLTYIIRNEDDILEEVLSWLLPSASVQVVITGSCGMKSLLKENLDVNHKDHEGIFPILEAVRMGSVQAVTALLKYGADVFVKNSRGLTPLHMAATEGDKELVAALVHFELHSKVHKLSLEDKTQAKTESSDTCRINALESDEGSADYSTEIQCCKWKYVNLLDPWGNTALLRAAAYSKTDCAKILLDNGADVNAENKDGLNALDLALLTGNVALSSILTDMGGKTDCEVDNFNRKLKQYKGNMKRRGGKLSKLRNVFRRIFEKKYPSINCPPIIIFASIHPSVFESCVSMSSNPAQLRTKGLQHLFDFMTRVHTRNPDGLSCITVYLSSGLYIIPVRFVLAKFLEDVVKYHILHGSDVDHALMNLSPRDWLFRDDHQNTLQLCLRACSFSPKLWSEGSLRSIHADTVDLMAEAWVKPLLEASSRFYDGLFTQQPPVETKSQDDTSPDEKLEQTEVFTPASLREVCRMQIRQALTHNVLFKVQALHLPSAMKDFICIRSDNDSIY